MNPFSRLYTITEEESSSQQVDSHQAQDTLDPSSLSNSSSGALFAQAQVVLEAIPEISNHDYMDVDADYGYMPNISLNFSWGAPTLTSYDIMVTIGPELTILEAIPAEEAQTLITEEVVEGMHINSILYASGDVTGEYYSTLESTSSGVELDSDSDIIGMDFGMLQALHRPGTYTMPREAQDDWESEGSSSNGQESESFSFDSMDDNPQGYRSYIEEYNNGWANIHQEHPHVEEANFQTNSPSWQATADIYPDYVSTPSSDFSSISRHYNEYSRTPETMEDSYQNTSDVALSETSEDVFISEPENFGYFVNQSELAVRSQAEVPQYYVEVVQVTFEEFSAIPRTIQWPSANIASEPEMASPCSSRKRSLEGSPDSDNTSLDERPLKQQHLELAEVVEEIHFASAESNLSQRRSAISYIQRIRNNRELASLGTLPRELSTPYNLRRTLPRDGSRTIHSSSSAEIKPARPSYRSRMNATPYLLREGSATQRPNWF